MPADAPSTVMNTDRPASLRKTVRLLLPYYGRYRRGLFLGFAALLLKSLAQAGLPLLIKRAVDCVDGGAWP